MNYHILTNFAAMPVEGSYSMKSLESDEFAKKLIKAIDEGFNLRNFISNETQLKLLSSLIQIELEPQFNYTPLVQS